MHSSGNRFVSKMLLTGEGNPATMESERTLGAFNLRGQQAKAMKGLAGV